MNTNIFRHELRSRFKSVMVWSLAVLLLVVLFLGFFQGFADEADLMNQMLEKFPREMRAAFGLDNLDLASVLGFYGFIFIFVQLCLAIQAGNYGFGLVSIEESELTADFLLTKPVSRTAVITSKLVAAVTGLILTNLVLWVGSFLAITGFRGEREYELKTLILILVSGFLFQMFFLGVGLLISLLVKRVRSVTPYGLGLGFGMYVLSAFSGMFSDVKLEILTPFKHFDPGYIIQNNAFDAPLVMLSVGVAIISITLSYWLYNRRDVPAVS